MKSGTSENIILWDWLTFTSKSHDPMELAGALGLGAVSWVQMDKGGYGYKSRLQFGNIKILYDGNENMGVCLEMSGQGCREFETYTKLPGKWGNLFRFIVGNKLNVTRLDVAFDDHTGLLDMDRLEQDTRHYNFVTRFKMDPEKGQGPRIDLLLRGPDVEPGKSIYFGMQRSKVMFRIYDKAAERGYTDGRHWVRFEMQLRDKRAGAFLDIVTPDRSEKLDDLGVGAAFVGVVRNYLRFVVPDVNDTNKRRWPMTDYWKELLGGMFAIRLATAPGAEYNMEKCKNTVVNLWGNAIAAVMTVCKTPRQFKQLIDARKCKPNKKYEIMLREYFEEEKRQQEAALRMAVQLGLDREEREYMEAERAGMEKEADFDDFQMNWWDASETI